MRQQGIDSMAAGVTREEFDALADEVAGEKTVTRHILEQTRRNGDDLAALKTRVGRVEEKVDNLDRKVDGLERKVDGLERRVDGVDRKVDGLMRDLPRIVGDTMREVLRERDVNR
jgi:predicted RNase H-like nuclease (RuvC/YqgF family)